MSHTTTFIPQICAYLQRLTSIDAEQSANLIESFEGKSRLDFESFLIEEGFVSKRMLLEALSSVYSLE